MSQEIVPFWQQGYDSLARLLSFYQNRPGVEIEIYGINDDRSGITVGIRTPFLSDRRGLDSHYSNLYIAPGFSDEIPQDFLDLVKPGTLDIYPENFQRYVANHLDKIKEALGLPELTEDEALDALVPNGNFQKWQEECSKWRVQTTPLD